MRQSVIRISLLGLSLISACAGEPDPRTVETTAPDGARILRAEGGTLTPPSTAEKRAIVRDFLRGRAPADQLVVASQTRSRGGISHLRLEQRAGGLRVHGAYVKAAITDDGELVQVIDATVPATPVARATATEAEARAAALAALGHEQTPAAAFHRAPSVERVAYADGGALREGFLVETWTVRDNLLDYTLVDGRGRVISTERRTSQDRYNVFAEDPGKGAQAIVTGGVRPESPAGWLGAGAQTTQNIRGNNVRAYLDVDSNNVADATGVAVTNGDFLAVANLTQAPSTTGNRDVAVQNLFYHNNLIHDVLYRHGFDEAAGNFQADNFGLGGAGNDPVNAEAQDGGGLDNANFATPTDGSAPRMQMYLWSGSTPPGLVTVNAIDYGAFGSAFGPALTATGVTGPLALVDDGRRHERRLRGEPRRLAHRQDGDRRPRHVQLHGEGLQRAARRRGRGDHREQRRRRRVVAGRHRSQGQDPVGDGDARRRRDAARARRCVGAAAHEPEPAAAGRRRPRHRRHLPRVRPRPDLAHDRRHERPARRRARRGLERHARVPPERRRPDRRVLRLEPRRHPPPAVRQLRRQLRHDGDRRLGPQRRRGLRRGDVPRAPELPRGRPHRRRRPRRLGRRPQLRALDSRLRAHARRHAAGRARRARLPHLGGVRPLRHRRRRAGQGRQERRRDDHRVVREARDLPVASEATNAPLSDGGAAARPRGPAQPRYRLARLPQHERGRAENVGMQALTRSPIAHRSAHPFADRLPPRAAPWRRYAGLLLLASLASCDGCIERNPNVCCTRDTECAQLGLPPGSASDYGCRQGQVCRDFYCVPEEVPDAAPPKPIVENGQRADLVLGQETFTTGDQNHGGLSARSLRFPRGVTIDEDGRLWGLDAGNTRALMWNPVPPASFAPAVLVAGASDFTTIGGSCPSNPSLFTPGNQLAARGGKLLIPYSYCNRVMIWNPGPTMNGAAASTVLGQASFTETTSGNGASDLFGPSGVWTDGTRVAVADLANHRVLIWSSFPTTNKQPADIVLGQPGFGTSGSATPPTGATMSYPTSVHSDGVRLFVADTGNQRVLVWRSFPTTHGQTADFVIGQPDLTSNGHGHGASQFTVPKGVTTFGDHLFVADSGNNRVLVFSSIPTTSGMPASFVLGQPSFETTDAGTTQETFSEPTSLVVGGNKLYVTDQSNHRVLRFDLKL